MNKEEAQKLAWNHICSAIPDRTVEISSAGVTEAPAQVEVAIVRTIEKEYGWIFLWQSKKYIESGDLRDMFLGNCPVLITKEGKLHLLPTSLPVEESLRRYELGLPLLPSGNAKRRQS
jgi:immunity protein 35 of polymorphic toxin system